ncbi:MAG TPA: VOC family protein [Pyrinomonadaceae bacterium]|jgi:hypothetical protein|nr:VOC family protein [Pyrinomonadaceae bacterium]
MQSLISATPCFPVADVGATIGWYREYLGFSANPFPDSEPYEFAILYRENAEIMLQYLKDYEKPNIYDRRPGGIWDAYFRMIGVREFYESIRNRLNVMRPLEKMPYPQIEFEVKDPNGYVLVFSETAE